MSVNFRFVGMHGVLRDLAILIRVGNHNQEHETSGSGIARRLFLENPDHIREMNSCVTEALTIAKVAETYLKWLECSHIDNAIVRLQRWAEGSDHTSKELAARAIALRDAVEIELKDYLFYQYPKDKGLKFSNWRNDWLGAIEVFPDIEVDAFSATDCYALGHNTASVFHSMRIAELGLRALAKERKVSLSKNKLIEWATWQEIISALDDECKLIGKTHKAGPEKDRLLAFCSGAIADFNGFKDEYRNSVMHVRSHYDQFQALRALTNVHGFMNRLATHTKPDKRHPIQMPEF